MSATVLALLWGASGNAAARNQVAPVDPVSYSRRVWQSTDGLPEDLAQAIAQTPDGYLWIGTSAGLVRFDGVHFTLFSHLNEPAFRDDSVYTLLVARDGALWAGTEGGGLVHLRAGVFRCYGEAEGLTSAFVRVAFEDRKGRLWVGTDGGLFRMTDGRFAQIDGRNGFPAMNVHSICEDRAGRLLVGGSGFVVLDGEQVKSYRSRESAADGNVRTIRQTADGAVWIGTISGLRHLPHGVRGDPFETRKLVRGPNVDFLLPARRGVLWVGTYGSGVMRYERGRWTRFSAPATLPHNNVLALFEDSEENVWVGTQGGLLRLSPSAARTITTADGAPLSINTIYADPAGGLLVTALNGRLLRVAGSSLEPVALPAPARGLRIRNAFRDSRGRLWLGTDGQGIVRLSGDEVVRYRMEPGLGNDFIRAFCEDRDGAIWIGTDGGLSRWSGGRFRAFATAAGQAYGSIRSIVQDRAGRLWAASEGGLSRLEGDTFVVDPALERLRGQKVWALREDALGKLWIGTQGAGLFVLADGELRQVTSRHGLPSDKVNFIAEDKAGRLWMSGPSGIASIARRDLEALAGDPGVQPAVRVYTTADGLVTNQMSGGVQSAGALTADGVLWLPSTKGVVRIATGDSDGEQAPPVNIEQVLADDRPVAVASGMTLPPGDGKLEIHYTAVRLRSPERIRFRYWMEGFERDWTMAGLRRIAYYTNVPPGRYRFHVVAYQMNAPQQSSEQVLELTWQPHFYQTRWFFALIALLLAVAGWGAYRLHLGNIHRRYAAVLEERGRLAREMHDTLIQGCIGVSTLLEAASRARDVSPQLGDELLDRARTEVRATVDEARSAIWDLRHGEPGGGGLGALVAQLVERVGSEYGAQVGFECTGPPQTLAGETERGLVLLIREALHNALRHAAPQKVAVSLRFGPRALEVTVEDDGRGFDPAAPVAADRDHYGLVGMRERIARLGGALTIDSALGRGTRVSLSVPVGKT